MQNNTTTTTAGSVPSWTVRAKVRKATPSGEVVANEYTYGGEVCRVSPRYQKNGSTFRVRFERPAVAFAAYCQENGLLPIQLSAEEAESKEGLDILEPVFAAYRHYFKGLEPAVTSGDSRALPNLTNGFSFLVSQVLVEKVGFATNGTTAAPLPTMTREQANEIAKKVEEMRAKKASKEAPKAEPKQEPKKK